MVTRIQNKRHPSAGKNAQHVFLLFVASAALGFLLGLRIRQLPEDSQDQEDSENQPEGPVHVGSQGSGHGAGDGVRRIPRQWRDADRIPPH